MQKQKLLTTIRKTYLISKTTGWKTRVHEKGFKKDHMTYYVNDFDGDQIISCKSLEELRIEWGKMHRKEGMPQEFYVKHFEVVE